MWTRSSSYQGQESKNGITLPQPPPPHQTKSVTAAAVYHLRIGIRWRYPQIAVLRGRGLDEPVDEPASTSHTRGDQLTPPDKIPSNGRGVSQNAEPPPLSSVPPSLRSCIRRSSPLSTAALPLSLPSLRPFHAPLLFAVPVQASRCSPPCDSRHPAPTPRGEGGWRACRCARSVWSCDTRCFVCVKRCGLTWRGEARRGRGGESAHRVARRERTGRASRLLARLDILAHHEELLTARVGATSEGRVCPLAWDQRAPAIPPECEERHARGASRAI